LVNPENSGQGFQFCEPCFIYTCTKSALKNYRLFWLALVWFIILTILLTLPGSSLPKEDWLDKIWFDKWVHIFLFAILALLFCRSFKNFSGKKLRLFLVIIIGCFFYGIIMEFVQKYFIPGRSFDIGDILADGIGSIIGGFIAARTYIKK